MSGVDLGAYEAFASKVIGVQFQNLQLLLTAFTHRSYLNEHKKSATEHNERLEFLGDAVLELVVTRFLYENFSEPEGILTNWRSALVRTETISAAAIRLGYTPLLRLSKGERRGGSERAREQMMANCFEAVIGALYLDQGYDAAAAFLHRELLPELESILSSGSWQDPKSSLQEMTQSKFSVSPQYRVLSEDGPDHEKIFTVGVFVNDRLLGSGRGNSKQAAQQKAAAQALRTLTAK